MRSVVGCEIIYRDMYITTIVHIFWYLVHSFTLEFTNWGYSKLKWYELRSKVGINFPTS